MFGTLYSTSVDTTIVIYDAYSLQLLLKLYGDGHKPNKNFLCVSVFIYLDRLYCYIYIYLNHTLVYVFIVIQIPLSILYAESMWC